MAKMEVSYSRRLDYQYMMIDAGEDVVTDYRLSMLVNNRISGFLPVHIQQMNGKSTLSYEITSLEALPAFLAARKISYDEIVSVLLQFCSAVQEVGRYLLDGEGILFEPEYIYVSKSLEQIRFCYYPYQHTPLYQSVNVFCRFLIDHIDYDDRKSLELAYGLFQESLKENLSIRAIVGCITAKVEEKVKDSADERIESAYQDQDNKEEETKPVLEERYRLSEQQSNLEKAKEPLQSTQRMAARQETNQSKKVNLSKKNEEKQIFQNQKKQGIATVFCTILIICILGYVFFTAGKRLLQLEIITKNLLFTAGILIILAAASAGLVAYWILKPKH